jgi:GntR family transcriptional regulator/MocR family aminotransferase
MFPYDRVINIRKESPTPVYRQIAIAIIHAVSNGTLQPGAILPGSREMAGRLGVHRKTVIAAYEELDAQDWIVITPRKHVAVSESIPSLAPQKWNPAAQAPYDHALPVPFRMVSKAAAKRPAAFPPTAPGMANTTSKKTAFPPPAAATVIDDGHPDIRLSPIDALLKTYRSLASRKHAVRNDAQGTLPLREELAGYLSETRGLSISPDNILITHGAQMSIYLAARLLLGPASRVIVGAPNYPVANQAFEETGAGLIHVKVDEDGIDTDAVEKICRKKKISAVYVIPHHHYPTTVTLSVQRRMKLLELSKRFSFAIIEDDYDYEYHYTSSPYLPLASTQHQGHVIYIGSFSKVLDPSIRLGFMVAPENFITQCTALRKMIDAGGDGYMQNALAALIRGGELKRHLKKARKCYYQRRNALDALLKSRLGKYISYTLPSGGMAIWVKVAPEVPVRALTANGPLQVIHVDEARNAFRFGFASSNEKELAAAVALLEKNVGKKKR